MSIGISSILVFKIMVSLMLLPLSSCIMFLLPTSLFSRMETNCLLLGLLMASYKVIRSPLTCLFSAWKSSPLPSTTLSIKGIGIIFKFLIRGLRSPTFSLLMMFFCSSKPATPSLYTSEICLIVSARFQVS